MAARVKTTGAAMPRLNKERGEFLFRNLAAMWQGRHNGGYLGGLIAPQQEHMPYDARGDSELTMRFLTFAALVMRGSVKSDAVLAFVHEFWLCHPQYFDLAVLAKTRPEDLLEAFRTTAEKTYPQRINGFVGSGPLSYKADEFARSLVQNGKIITREFDGDPRRIFAGAKSFAEVMSRTRLNGIGTKIMSLWALWLLEFRLIEESFTVPGVVDFHFMRLLTANGVVEFEARPLREVITQQNQKRFSPHLHHHHAARGGQKITDYIAYWSAELLEELGLSSYDVSHGSWFHSREFCKRYPGNRATSNRGHARRRDLVITGFADLEALRRGIGWPDRPNYCSGCPLASTCKLSIPNVSYYRTGVLIVLGPRVKQPTTESPIITDLPRDFRKLREAKRLEGLARKQPAVKAPEDRQLPLLLSGGP